MVKKWCKKPKNLLCPEEKKYLTYIDLDHRASVQG